MAKVTRRQIIVGSTVTGAILLAGGGFVVAQDHRSELPREIIIKSVGHLNMHDDQFAPMLDEIYRPFQPSMQRLAFYRSVLAAGPIALDEMKSHRIGVEFEELQRRVLTEFYTKTDYLAISDSSGLVRYLGANACSSPFANFA